MGSLMSPPFSPVEPVVDILHGVPITDPYRWLEEQDSPRTRAWIEEQTRYTRTYLDAIPGRAEIRRRIREFLSAATYDSFLVCGSRYFFRKRLPGEEQPSIYERDAAGGTDRRLVEPAKRGTGSYTALKPLRVSPDGNLLLYEVKQGGERTGSFEILDIKRGEKLRDSLPHGYLRGFEFSPDSQSFYFVHEPTPRNVPLYRAVYQHVIGTPSSDDREAFAAGSDSNVRLSLSSSRVANYESINAEDLHGWYSGDGMANLYNSDLTQFCDDFWPTVNSDRLPGTTIDTQTRADGSGAGARGAYNWVGGATLDGWGAAGMQLDGWSSTLTAKN